MKIDLKGNTSQDSTTGKNLWSLNPTYTNDTTSVKWVLSDTQFIVSAGTYTISCNAPSGAYIRINYKYADNVDHLTTLTNNKVTITFTDEVKKVALQLGASTTISNIQFEAGSQATSYEPYTNGASPNPDYPQDIHVVSGDNSIDVCGKNLFNKGSISTGYLKEDATLSTDTAYRTSDFMPIQPNTTYYKTSTGSPRTKYFDINKVPLNTTTYWDVPTGGSAGTFTTPNNAYYLRFSFPFIGSSAIDIDTIMVKEGTATDYEPYQGASYPINLGVENLLQCNIVSTTISGVTITNNNDESFTLQGTATAGIGRDIHGEITLKAGTYTFSADHLPAGVYISLANVSNTILNRNTPSRTFTINTDTTYAKCLLWIDNGYSVNDTIKIQLEKGSKQNSFTPYGKAIELCKIGDYQDSIKKSTGKNLWNGTFELGGIDTTTGQDGAATDRVRTKGYVEVKPNTTYTLSGVQGSRVVCFYNSSKAYLSYVVAGSQSTNGTFTTPNNTSYIRWYIIQTNTNIYEMLNEGSTALPYEPYGTSWYVNKQIGKVVLDGSESWTNYTNLGNNSRCYYIKPNAFSLNSQLFSNYFIKSNLYETDETGIIINPYGTSLISIKIPNSDLETQDLAGYKTWLSTHNTTVYYVLATPTYTEITDSTLLSQLNALAKSYNSQTNISQESNDLASLLNATALEETE